MKFVSVIVIYFQEIYGTNPFRSPVKFIFKMMSKSDYKFIFNNVCTKQQRRVRFSPSRTACRSLWCCLPRRACPALGDDSALWPAICPLLPTPITAVKYDWRNILKTWHLPLTGSSCGFITIEVSLWVIAIITYLGPILF